MMMPVAPPGHHSGGPVAAGPTTVRGRTAKVRAPAPDPACTGLLRPVGPLRRQPVTLTAPVSMWPVARRLQLESLLTVTVKSYQPLAMVTALK